MFVKLAFSFWFIASYCECSRRTVCVCGFIGSIVLASKRMGANALGVFECEEDYPLDRALHKQKP